MLELIQELPKTELHCHIEGTLEPELTFQLAKRNNIKLPYESVEALRNAYQFTDLQSFLDLYHQGLDVLQTEQDFYDLTFAYMTRVHQDNVVHTEIFFIPEGHMERGIAFETFFTGITRALADAKKMYGMSSRLIACFQRHLPVSTAAKMLDILTPYQADIIAVGLESTERNNPPSKYTELFQTARDRGFLTVAHAGEEGPPAYMWEALDLLKVKRIDHGVRAIEDEKLIERLVKDQIPLTVCPLSNVKLCVFKDMKQHPIQQLLERGVCVTVNSDDPSYFGGYVMDNYRALIDALPLTQQEVVQIIKNGFAASFISEEEKQHWYQEIDKRVGLHKN